VIAQGVVGVLGTLLVVSLIAGQPLATVPGTGVLYMYSDSGCTTLLPQLTGRSYGYILPATGTTVYIQIKSITETGITNINLKLSTAHENLATTVAEGQTGCVAWTVGTFESGGGAIIGCSVRGGVSYGTSADPNEFQTRSTDGTDGGHFYGQGTAGDAKCAPSLTTALSATTVETGWAVTDSAFLINTTAAASGTITFYWSTVDTCPNSASTQVGSPVSISGSGEYVSPTQTFSSAGTYYWYAVYSGDFKDNAATGACEPLTVLNGGTSSVPEFPVPMILVAALGLVALAGMRRYNVIRV
jgi:hypothetical protein